MACPPEARTSKCHVFLGLTHLSDRTFLYMSPCLKVNFYPGTRQALRVGLLSDT